MFGTLFGRDKGDKPLLDGAYRLHREEDVDRFTALAVEAFPEFAGRITCFGADWLGRQLATDTGRLEKGRPGVLMLEPGTGEALEIPEDREGFHAQELAEHADAAVALSFFHDWRRSGGAAPAYDQCIGYRIPLYLGGADETSNLELSDFDVYWTLSAQLLEQLKVRAAPGEA
jgi:hypothetical protein